MKRKKYVEDLNIASGTEMMRASQMRPTIFKDKSKYNRKLKHKNRQDKNSGDSFFLLKPILGGTSQKTPEKYFCQIYFLKPKSLDKSQGS